MGISLLLSLAIASVTCAPSLSSAKLRRTVFPLRTTSHRGLLLVVMFALAGCSGAGRGAGIDARIDDARRDQVWGVPDAPAPADVFHPTPADAAGDGSLDQTEAGPSARGSCAGVLGVGGATAIAHSRDGQLVAIGSAAGLVRVVRAADGVTVAVLGRERAPVADVAFSHDAKTVAVAVGDAVVLWRLADGAELRRLGSAGFAGFSSTAFSPDGAAVMAAGTTYQRLTQVVAWKVADGSTLWAGPGDLQQAQQHPPMIAAGGDVFASVHWISPTTPPDAGPSRAADRWYTSIQRADSPHGTPARSVPGWPIAIAADGSVVATRESDDGPVQLWRVRDGVALRALPGDVRRVALSADGALVASSRPGDVAMARVSDGAVASTIVGAELGVVAVSGNGKALVAGSGLGAIGWTVADGKPAWTLEGPDGDVRAFAFSSDGKLVATAEKASVRIWSAGTWTPLRVFSRASADLTGITFSPDGARIAHVDPESVGVLSAGDGKVLWSARPARRQFPSTVAWSPDGAVVASGVGDQTVMVLDAASGRELRVIGTPVPETLKGVQLVARVAVAFSPDGKLIAVGGENSGVYRTSDGTRALSIRPTGTVAFSGDGALLALQGAEDTIVIRVADGAQVGPAAKTGQAAALSGDGELLAIDTRVDGVELWSWRTGMRLPEVAGPNDNHGGVAFSPSGETMGALLNGAAVRFWCARR